MGSSSRGVPSGPQRVRCRVASVTRAAAVWRAFGSWRRPPKVLEAPNQCSDHNGEPVGSWGDRTVLGLGPRRGQAMLSNMDPRASFFTLDSGDSHMLPCPYMFVRGCCLEVMSSAAQFRRAALSVRLLDQQVSILTGLISQPCSTLRPAERSCTGVCSPRSLPARSAGSRTATSSSASAGGGGELLATSGDCVRIWSSSGELRRLLRHEANPRGVCCPITAIDVDPEAGAAPVLASCDVYGTCALWDLETGAPRQRPVDLGQALLDVAFGPNG
ncbi:unnamed protein product, partial [Prorocentrum cordatum]